jgi:hypothetical protein
MRKRHPNPNHVKIHRSYTVEEVATLYGCHKNTVRNWVKNGLSTINDKRPMLILGHVLREFLQLRREKNKRPCKPGELYCVRCRTPRLPADKMVHCTQVSEKISNMAAICPDCDSIMNQLVSLAKIEEVYGNMDITFSQELSHVINSTEPTVNSAFK